MLWLLAPLASASTVHVDSDAPVDVSVGTERTKVAAGGTSQVSKLDGGTFRVQVTAPDGSTWAGDLAIPHDAEVWLSWRQGTLMLVQAARQTASGATRAANTVMAIGAGAQAASDIVSAGSAASEDMAKVSRGEATESSDTQIEVGVGAGGVSSSTSRTTAGESGVHHESTSTSIGPDGVARSTTTADANLGGASIEQQDTSVSRIEIPGEGGPAYVSLVQVDATAAAPGKPAEKPKTLWYQEPAGFDAGGAHWTLHDPVAEGDTFKLQVRIAVTGSEAVVWEPATSSARFDGADVASRGGKPVVVLPGGDGRDVVNFVQPDGDLRVDAPVLSLGNAATVARGADLGFGTIDAVPGQKASAGDLACEVKSTTPSKKATSVSLECVNGGSAWAWLAPAAAKVGVGDEAPLPNAAKKTGMLLVAPGTSERISIDVPIGSKQAAAGILRAHLAGLGLAAVATPVALVAVPLAIDEERTAEEN